MDLSKINKEKIIKTLFDYIQLEINSTSLLKSKKHKVAYTLSSYKGFSHKKTFETDSIENIEFQAKKHFLETEISTNYLVLELLYQGNKIFYDFNLKKTGGGVKRKSDFYLRTKYSIVSWIKEDEILDINQDLFNKCIDVLTLLMEKLWIGKFPINPFTIMQKIALSKRPELYRHVYDTEFNSCNFIFDGYKNAITDEEKSFFLDIINVSEHLKRHYLNPILQDNFRNIDYFVYNLSGSYLKRVEYEGLCRYDIDKRFISDIEVSESEIQRAFEEGEWDIDTIESFYIEKNYEPVFNADLFLEVEIKDNKRRIITRPPEYRFVGKTIV